MEEDRGDTGWLKDGHNELHDPCAEKHEAGLTVNGCGNICRKDRPNTLLFCSESREWIMKRPLEKNVSHARSLVKLARGERAWVGGPNGI